MAETCGARTRAGTPCKLPAGWGTDHSGSGRCKLHGGASTGAPPEKLRGNKNALKHGAYETVIRDCLDPDEQAVFDAIPADQDLTSELRILRFKLLRLLDEVERQTVVGTKVGAEVVTIEVDEVTKAYAIEKLVDGIRKLVKDMQGAGDDGALTGLVQMLGRLREGAED